MPLIGAVNIFKNGLESEETMKDQMTEHSLSKADSAGRTGLSAGQLMQEAKQQSQALKTIGRWRTIGFVVAAVGAVLLYNGLTGAGRSIPLIAIGTVIVAAGMAAAILCDMGIRNGRRNVEKILDAAQRESSQKARENT
jgi:hypothetical protein